MRSSRRWGRNGQLQFEFNSQEENDAISFTGKAYPRNIIRISQFCTDIIDSNKPARLEVPFTITAGKRNSGSQDATLVLKSFFG